MANRKAISVNESSLVDLKAELYRKETQFKREKNDVTYPKKAPIWQKKKNESKKKAVEVEDKSSSDTSYDKELEKSRLMLEAKSALYEKLSKGQIEVPSDEDEQHGRFLVDFYQKTIPKQSDSCNENVGGNNDDELEGIPPANNPDEEWVDYMDSFGRSRKCLKKDFPAMKEKDEKSKVNFSQDKSIPTLLSDDMRREMIRKRWEKEVEEALDKPVGPVHYQDVLFDETRDHGVGYYKFSKLEDERQQQQMILKKLRAQTEQQRNKREKLLEKRKAAMDARLAKVRERKQRKLKEQGFATDNEEKATETGEMPKPDTADERQASNSKDETGISVDDFVDRIRNKSNRIEKSHLNEWEKNKVDVSLFDKPKTKTPVYNARSERNPEFAPPPSYATQESGKKKFSKETKWRENASNNSAEMTTDMGKSETLLGTSVTCEKNTQSYPHETPSTSCTSQVPTASTQPSFTGHILPNLPPPPTHAFPPPLPLQFLPSMTHPPLFPPPNPPTYPYQFPASYDSYSNTTSYPQYSPGVDQYPSVPIIPPGSHSPNTTSAEVLPPHSH